MIDKNYEALLNEVKEIKRFISIIAQDKIIEFRKTIENNYLTTEQRKKMYEKFDGTKSYKDIADELKISSEAVRIFAATLDNDGIIEHVNGPGKVKFPKRKF